MFTFASGRSLRRVLWAGLCAATLAEWRWREMRLCPTTDIRFPAPRSVDSRFFVRILCTSLERTRVRLRDGVWRHAGSPSPQVSSSRPMRRVVAQSPRAPITAR